MCSFYNFETILHSLIWPLTFACDKSAYTSFLMNLRTLWACHPSQNSFFHMRRLSIRGCPLEMSDLESTIQINQDIKKQKQGHSQVLLSVNVLIPILIHERVTSAIDQGNCYIRQQIGARITRCKGDGHIPLVWWLFEVQGEFKHRGDNHRGSSALRHRRNYLLQIHDFPKGIIFFVLMAVHTSFDFP